MINLKYIKNPKDGGITGGIYRENLFKLKKFTIQFPRFRVINNLAFLSVNIRAYTAYTTLTKENKTVHQIYQVSIIVNNNKKILNNINN